MRALLLIALVGLAGCGKAQSNDPVLDVGAFAPYVKHFEQQARPYGGVQVTDLVVQLGTFDAPDEAGTCITAEGETPRIVLDARRWAIFAETQRQILMDHELGHCVLRRVHRDDRLPDGRPASIMHSTMLGAVAYDQATTDYLAELFSERGQY